MEQIQVKPLRPVDVPGGPIARFAWAVTAIVDGQAVARCGQAHSRHTAWRDARRCLERLREADELLRTDRRP